MAKLSKRVKAFRARVDANKSYPLDEAIAILKETATVKFNESVELAVNLGIDARKSDQGVRGATTLPHGTGSEVRVAVFTQGENAEKAKEAGADLVGMEDLADQIKGGMMDFDVVVASPDAMRVVGQLGQVLGPRGLMPNPKTGTVTPDVATAVQNAKAGQMRFRTDKNGIIHGGIGKSALSRCYPRKLSRRFGRPQEGEAGCSKRRVFSEGDTLDHDGSGRHDRSRRNRILS
jgi:large subunit ribosomal protein L1